MFRELSIELVRATIFKFLQLLTLENVGEFFLDQVFLLFIKDVDFFFNVVEPRMKQDFLGCEAPGDVLFEHVLHQVARQLRDCVTILDLLLVELMGQVTDLVRFEGDISVENSVQADSSRPYIDWEAFIADFLDDLRSYVSRSTALLKQKLVLVHPPTDAEIANLNVALTV